MGDDARQEETRAPQGAIQARAIEGREARRGRRREGRVARPTPRVAALLQPWWERDPSLLAEEISGLERAGFRVHQGVNRQGRLALTATEGARAYRIVYAHAFPDEGASITDGSLTESETRLVRATGPVPVGASGIDQLEHDRPVALQRLASVFSVLSLPELTEVGARTGGRLRFGVATGPTIALLGVGDGDREPVVDVVAERLARAFPVASQGWWVRGDPPDWSDEVETIAAQIEERVAALRRVPATVVRAEALIGRIAALAYTRSSAPGASTQWLFMWRSAERGVRLGTIEPYRPGATLHRAPFADRLKDRAVAVVGCGALGWSIALSLARAGVGRFALYDPDVVHASNLPRLAARVPWVGEFKVVALAAEIAEAAPHATVVREPFAVGAHLGARALVDQHVDLIVDATADHRSPSETNLAALASGAAALYAWTSPGVVAARVFRVVPERTACYACVRNHGPAPIRAERRMDRCWTEEFTWNGANFNVEMVASVATRMAVRTLLGHAADETNPDHLVLELGGPVPTTRVISIPRDPHCEVCGG